MKKQSAILFLAAVIVSSANAGLSAYIAEPSETTEESYDNSYLAICIVASDITYTNNTLSTPDTILNEYLRSKLTLENQTSNDKGMTTQINDPVDVDLSGPALELPKIIISGVMVFDKIVKMDTVVQPYAANPSY